MWRGPAGRPMLLRRSPNRVRGTSERAIAVGRRSRNTAGPGRQSRARRAGCPMSQGRPSRRCPKHQADRGKGSTGGGLARGNQGKPPKHSSALSPVQRPRFGKRSSDLGGTGPDRERCPGSPRQKNGKSEAARHRPVRYAGRAGRPVAQHGLFGLLGRGRGRANLADVRMVPGRRACNERGGKLSV